MRLKRKDLLGIEELEKDEIELILSSAESFKEVSTRTPTSFELAAKRMSADAINISVSASSVSKGETLKDTVLNLEAMNPDCVVVRHSSSGAPHMIARHLKSSVVNAGDGAHEHPSQALLDLFTIKEKSGEINGLNIAIIGDIAHSRVARSNIHGFTKLGAKVTVCGPPTMIPPGIESLGCRVTHDMTEEIKHADVIMMLRLQLERQKKGLFPSVREYSSLYGLNKERLKKAKKGVLIMHPGPVNRGVEISPEVADGETSLILEQVTNGVAIRMSIFYLLLGGVKE